MRLSSLPGLLLGAVWVLLPLSLCILSARLPPVLPSLLVSAVGVLLSVLSRSLVPGPVVLSVGVRIVRRLLPVGVFLDKRIVQRLFEDIKPLGILGGHIEQFLDGLVGGEVFVGRGLVGCVLAHVVGPFAARRVVALLTLAPVIFRGRGGNLLDRRGDEQFKRPAVALLVLVRAEVAGGDVAEQPPVDRPQPSRGQGHLELPAPRAGRVEDFQRNPPLVHAVGDHEDQIAQAEVVGRLAGKVHRLVGCEVDQSGRLDKADPGRGVGKRFDLVPDLRRVPRQRVFAFVLDAIAIVAFDAQRGAGHGLPVDVHRDIAVGGLFEDDPRGLDGQVGFGPDDRPRAAAEGVCLERLDIGRRGRCSAAGVVGPGQAHVGDSEHGFGQDEQVSLDLVVAAPHAEGDLPVSRGGRGPLGAEGRRLCAGLGDMAVHRDPVDVLQPGPPAVARDAQDGIVIAAVFDFRLEVHGIARSDNGPSRR